MRKVFALAAGLAALAACVVVVAQSTQTSTSQSTSQSGSGSATASGSSSARAQAGGSNSGFGRGGGSINGAPFNNVKGPGFLVVWTMPGDSRRPVVAGVVEEHKKFIRENAINSGIMMEGPRMDGPARIALIFASQEQVRRVSAGSPLVQKAGATFEVVPWNVEHSSLFAPGQTAAGPAGG